MAVQYPIPPILAVLDMTPAEKAQAELLAIERQTQRRVLRVYRKIRLEIEEQIRLLGLELAAAEAEGRDITINLINRQNRLKNLLDGVTRATFRVSNQMAGIVADSQADAIVVARRRASEVAQFSRSSLTFFDSAAVENLIGFSSNGEAIDELFKNIAKPLRQSMFDTLASGIGQGKPVGEITTELRRSLNIGRAQAATIARTETNRIYRETTRMFYDENDQVLGWRWIATLDLRTCIICWNQHGRIYATSTKFATHPNCRCTMQPVFVKGERFTPGTTLFNRLEPAQQKTILGVGRFNLFNEGVGINKFSTTFRSPFGLSRKVVNIADINQ